MTKVLNNYRVTFINVTNKSYVPVFERITNIQANNAFEAKAVFERSFGNDKKSKVVKVERIDSEGNILDSTDQVTDANGAEESAEVVE